MGDYKPTSKTGWGIQPIEKNPGGQGGDLHDTFKVDRDGNISGGHTTVQTPGKPPVHMPWDRK